MAQADQNEYPALLCDAMCGGLARWLRAFGTDAAHVPGIDDAELVKQALAESRLVVSSDGRLFARRVFTSGRLSGLRMPVGLRLRGQLEYVVVRLALRVGFPRCTRCNGELLVVRRAEVGDVVPVRSLIWAKAFFRCAACEHVSWEGTHWRHIERVRRALAFLSEGRRSDFSPGGTRLQNIRDAKLP